MKKNKVNLDNEHNIIQVWQELKNEISMFSKRRKELMKNIDEKQITEMLKNYTELEDEEEKRKIEEIVILYNFPMILIMVKKGYMMMKNTNYIKDLFMHLMVSVIEALKRYNNTNENKFSTYLAVCLKGETIKFVDNTRIIKYNYYYTIQKKNKEPITILTESEIEKALDIEEDSVVSYAFNFDPNSSATDMETEKKIKNINILIDTMKHYLMNIYETNEINKKILYEYFFSQKTSREVSVNNLSQKYNKGQKECYNIIKNFINNFKNYCEKEGGKITEIYYEIKEDVYGLE